MSIESFSQSQVQDYYSVKPHLGAINDAVREFSLGSVADQDGPATTGLLLEHPEQGELDVTVVAAWLSASVKAPIIIRAKVSDHDPYNLARRVGGLYRAHQGPVGVLLEAGPLDRLTQSLFTGSQGHREAEGNAPDYLDLWVEYAQLLVELWQSLPISALTADVETGDFSAPGAIAAVNFSGRYYRVAGPLNAPFSQHGRPLIVAESSEEDSDAWQKSYRFAADLVIRKQDSGVNRYVPVQERSLP